MPSNTGERSACAKLRAWPLRAPSRPRRWELACWDLVAGKLRAGAYSDNSSRKEAM